MIVHYGLHPDLTSLMGTISDMALSIANHIVFQLEEKEIKYTIEVNYTGFINVQSYTYHPIIYIETKYGIYHIIDETNVYTTFIPKTEIDFLQSSLEE